MDGPSGEPDAVGDTTSSFPQQAKAAGWWSIHFKLCPVSVGTQRRVKAPGGYFVYQTMCALGAVDYFHICFNTGHWYFFLALCTSAQ